MWANKQFIVATLYGHSFGRPGLYSWLILLPTSVLGEQNILVAARLVTVCSTVLIGLILAWLVRKIFNDRLLSAFAAAVFLSGDVLLYRGWLAYVDPLFSLFSFAAMACLWVATEQRRRDLLIVAGALSDLHLSREGSDRIRVLRRSWARSVVAARESKILAHPVIHIAPSRRCRVSLFLELRTCQRRRIRMDEIRRHAPAAERRHTERPHLCRTVYRLSVSNDLVFVAGKRDRHLLSGVATDSSRRPAAESAAGRSVHGCHQFAAVPLYPLFALLMAYVVFNSGKLMIDLCAKALIAAVVVAYLAALIGFPLYEHFIRGSYDNAAQAIIARAGSFPLYAADDSSVGLSIVADINTRRLPAPPVTRPPAEFSSGFVLSLHPDPAIGQIYTTFAVGYNPNGSRTRYLLCRGTDCSTGGNPTDKSLAF